MYDASVFVLLFFVAASIVLYVVLGGADYGAGIIELLPIRNSEIRRKQREIVNRAMGPVWEANHMWLVIIVVILFMGFPVIFQNVMVSLHIPIVAVLIGIVARGSVFTFRHYEVELTPTRAKAYTISFGLSSLWTSFWLGVTAGSLFRGLISTQSADFYTLYVAPWFGLFPLSLGFFTTSIFSFLAAIFLVGESQDIEMKKYFVARAWKTNLFVIGTGAVVFLSASIEGYELMNNFFKNPLAVLAFILANISFFVLWFKLQKRRSFYTRLIAAAQVSFILIGWFAMHWPNALKLDGIYLSFFNSTAPEPVLNQLIIALLLGSCFIFPSLFFLIRTFKMEKKES
ncbi:MAG: cytochrome d ubiquinol oxidase subunit II [Bdellovibrionota bacterium]|nr:cytochrome d ubiquinol oxidase subunit II [Bdellovibrionota bacterium]